MGVLGIPLAWLVVDEFERRVDLVTNERGQRLDVDIVGRPDVQYLAVGAVVGQELLVDPTDVGDVREVPGLLAGPVDNRWFAVETPRDEVRDRHVRSHPRPVDGEVPQRDCRQPVDLVVDTGVLFGCELGHTVRGDGLGRVVLVVREVLGSAVDRRGGGNHDPVHVVAAGRLENLDRPVHVVPVDPLWLLHALADTRLCRLVVDHVGVGDEFVDE